jgi:hypothetical protein
MGWPKLSYPGQDGLDHRRVYLETARPPLRSSSSLRSASYAILPPPIMFQPSQQRYQAAGEDKLSALLDDSSWSMSRDDNLDMGIRYPSGTRSDPTETSTCMIFYPWVRPVSDSS